MKDIEKKILDALKDERFKVRTIKGVAAQAHISSAEVIKQLKSSAELNKSVKIYPRRSKDGRVLLTTREKYEKNATLADKFIDAFATNRVRIEDEL